MRRQARELPLAKGTTEVAHIVPRAGAELGGGMVAKSVLLTSLKSCLEETALSNRPFSRPG